MGSVCLPEVASGDREDFKRRHFQEVGLADAVFVPFVIEATGRLGGAARRWIDITFGRAHQTVLKSMLRSISMRITKMNSKMIEAGRGIFQESGRFGGR
jgi:hypothetical protein